MDDELLRDEIYKRLGVEKGSLSSESGNDWQRAKNEVLEEWKAAEQENNSEKNELDYEKLSKDTKLFKVLLSDTSFAQQEAKAILATRGDLTEDEMLQLSTTGDKEVLINLSRQLTLPSLVIDNIISRGTYMSKKTIVEHHTLSMEQKERLLSHFNQHTDTYDISLKSRLQG